MITIPTHTMRRMSIAQDQPSTDRRSTLIADAKNYDRRGSIAIGNRRNSLAVSDKLCGGIYLFEKKIANMTVLIRDTENNNKR